MKMKHRKIGLILSFLAVLLAASFFVYVSDNYTADETALKALVLDEVIVEETDYGWFFDGSSEDTALIFYPGAKVDEKAYAPLLHELAQKGMDVCLIDSPFDIGFFNLNGADKALKQYHYDKWYIGGHSLGGVIASLYLQKHPDDFAGLILLASYTNKQMPDQIREIVIVGSEDGVINKEALAKGRELSSKDYREFIIEGGNHCQFGSYGFQKGDQEAKITARQQIDQTADLIISNTQQ